MSHAILTAIVDFIKNPLQKSVLSVKNNSAFLCFFPKTGSMLLDKSQTFSPIPLFYILKKQQSKCIHYNVVKKYKYVANFANPPSPYIRPSGRNSTNNTIYRFSRTTRRIGSRTSARRVFDQFFYYFCHFLAILDFYLVSHFR